MSAIAPRTDVYLLKVPLEIDNTNQLTFSNATAQYNYFNSLPKMGFDTDFTYQRKDGIIRIPALIDDIITFNYVMYKNENHSDKWFYAYIDKMEYINDSMTAVSITTDVWQTWQFSLNYKPTFVEREHTNNDAIGNNILPENVDLGEYIFNGNAVDFGKTNLATANICLGVSEIISPFDNNPLTNWLTVYGGIYSGLSYMFFDSFVSLQRVIDYYNVQGKAGAIQTIFYVPQYFIAASDPKTQTYSLQSPTNTATVVWIEPSEAGVDEPLQTFTRPQTLTTYTPKNKKLLTFPYCYFTITNNGGTEVPYHYEDFNGSPQFSSTISLTPSMSSKASSPNYKNGNWSNGWSEGIVGCKTPQCSWTTDYYVNWLTQNAVNNVTQATSIGLSAGTALGTGNVISGASSLINGIGNIIGEHYKASLVPDQVHGDIGSGDVNFSSDKCCFTYLPKCIKPQYARIIDDYFSMFGYATHEVKTPNITGRRNWNYVKTLGCYIEADIPQEDLQTIKNMFDSGVTFWHNANTFGDYNQNNDII